ARDAMPQGGKLTIETKNVELDDDYKKHQIHVRPGAYVLLAVSDSGCGITEEVRARIFEPFFTTKGVGKGTGLGLATVYGIVKQSGGFVWVESSPGKGSRFEVYLPQVSETSNLVATVERVAPSAVPGAPTILVVEDDAAVRELASKFLDTAGYRVLAAKDGLEALQIAKDCGH